jgi:hypothetical protein
MQGLFDIQHTTLEVGPILTSADEGNLDQASRFEPARGLD